MQLTQIVVRNPYTRAQWVERLEPDRVPDRVKWLQEHDKIIVAVLDAKE